MYDYFVYIFVNIRIITTDKIFASTEIVATFKK